MDIYTYICALRCVAAAHAPAMRRAGQAICRIAAARLPGLQAPRMPGRTRVPLGLPGDTQELLWQTEHDEKPVRQVQPNFG